MKDLILRHRGEVREISGAWVLVDAPFPTEERFHHAQFAHNDAGRKALTTFTGKRGRMGGKQGGKGGDGHWRQEEEEEDSWSNTMVMTSWCNRNNHYVRDAKCFGLAELFFEFGDKYTAKALYRYYLSTTILAHKRVHSNSKSVKSTAASHQRKTWTGKWGHGKGY